MILDLLISKYLDGDLTADEDRALRAKVAADREAKEAFDAAVLLHIAMRCEDDEAMPEGEADRVLAVIHQRMFAAELSPSFGDVPPRSVMQPLSRGATRRRVGVLAVLLLLSIIPIAREGFRGALPQHGIASRLSAPDEGAAYPTTPPTVQTTTGIVQPPSAPTRSLRRHGAMANTTMATVVSRADDVASSGHEGCAPAPAPPQASAGVFHRNGDEPLGAGPTLAARMGGDLTAQLGAGRDVPTVNSTDHAAVPTPQPPKVRSVDVLLSTFYAQSIGGGSSSHGTVTQIAQSVGYATGSSTWVGLELGATSYDVTMDYSGPKASSASDVAARPGGSIASESDGPAKFPEWVTPGGTYDRMLFTGTNQSRTFWGAAFVQQALVRTSMLGVQGRAGAGAGQDGFVAYGRLQGEIHVVPSVALTIGSEARLIPFRTGAAPAKDVDRTYGTIFSLLYGVQIRL